MFRIERFIAAENGLAIENRGVGNRQHYKDGLIVGALPGSSVTGARAMHHQYGSDAVLENIVFAGFGSVGFDGTDTGPTQASFRLINIGFIGPRPNWVMTDLAVYDLADDSIAPRGFYASLEAPWLATPSCTRQDLGKPGQDAELWWRCPAPVRYAELELRDTLASTFSTKVNPFLRRSDGLRYRIAQGLGTAGAGSLGAGMHSTTVIYNGGLGYAIDAPPSPGGWAARLSATAVASAGADLDADTAWVTVDLPAAVAPRGVHRTGLAFDQPDAPTAANALRAAASLADNQANARSTYFYDADSRTVRVQVSARWVVVLP